MDICLTDSLHVQMWRHIAQAHVISVKLMHTVSQKPSHLQVTLKLSNLWRGSADHSCTEMLRPALVYVCCSILLLPYLFYASVPSIVGSAFIVRIKQ